VLVICLVLEFTLLQLGYYPLLLLVALTTASGERNQ